MANELMAEFIESKGLMNEYIAFEKAKKASMNGYIIKFDVMLGDADGHFKDELHIQKGMMDEFRKYFEAPEWGKDSANTEIADIAHEFIPGASIYADQLEKLFHNIYIGHKGGSIRTDNKHSLASFNFGIEQADVPDWEKWEYFDDADTYMEDIQSMFEDIYFRYVLPYVKEGKFETADAIGTYGLSARV